MSGVNAFQFTPSTGGLRSTQNIGPVVNVGMKWPPIIVATGSPLITNIVPVTGTFLTPNQTIQFDVISQATPARAFRVSLILAQYPNIGIYEVIYDNSSFSSNYTGTLVSLANGFRFTGISRIGGWPGAPRIIPITVDIAGLINS